MTPNYSARRGKRYRDYVTQSDQIPTSPARRVPADDIGPLGRARVSQLRTDRHRLCELAGDQSAKVIGKLLARADTTAAAIRSGAAHEKSPLLMAIIARFALRADGIDVSISRDKLADPFCEMLLHEIGTVVAEDTFSYRALSKTA